MRRRNFDFYFILSRIAPWLFLFLWIIIKKAGANPVVAYPTPFHIAESHYPSLLLAVLFIPIVIVEFLVAWSLLRPGRKFALFLAILFINAVSYVLTILVSLFVFFFSVIFTIIFEYCCYRIFFPLCQIGDYSGSKSLKGKYFQTSVLANLLTFAIGVAVSVGFAPEPGPYRPPPSRAKVYMRSLASALEAYNMDWKVYPERLVFLTTPTAYVTGIFPDPLFRGEKEKIVRPFQYFFVNDQEEKNSGFLLWSAGLDGDYDLTRHIASDLSKRHEEGSADLRDSLAEFLYDPTNGTEANGDLFRMGGSWSRTQEDRNRDSGSNP